MSINSKSYKVPKTCPIILALVPWSQRFDLIFPLIRQPRESREAVNTSREAGRKKTELKAS